MAFIAREPGGTTAVWVRALDDPRGENAGRNRGSPAPVLVAGRPVRGVLRGRSAQASRDLRRPAPDARPRDDPKTAALPGAQTTGSSSRRSYFGPLLQVSASGGKVTPATTLDKARSEGTHRWPWFLPDGRHFLYYAAGSTGSEPGEIFVGELDSGQGEAPPAVELARRLRVPGVPSVHPRQRPGRAGVRRRAAGASGGDDASRSGSPGRFGDGRPAGPLGFSGRNALLAHATELDEPAGPVRSPGTRDRQARGGRDLELPSPLAGRAAAGDGAGVGRIDRLRHLDDRPRAQRRDANDARPGGRRAPDLVARRNAAGLQLRPQGRFGRPVRHARRPAGQRGAPRRE